MKCDEVQPLHGPYLDSELDAKTTLEIQRHLLGCADCDRVFATEGKLDARIMAGLKQGQRTAALWEQVEHRVLAAAQSAARPQRPAHEAHPTSWWRELLWPCPQAWAGLAAVWAVILAVNFVSSGDAPRIEARRREPPSREIWQMLQQQRQMLAELGGTAEKIGVARFGSPAAQPRSQRREQLMNT